MKKVLLAVAAMALLAAPAMAAAPSELAAGQGGVNTAQYHSYDGLICTDCHTLHGSEDGANVVAGGWAGGDGYRELLKKGDWTDMCLSCHKQGFNTAGSADLPSVVQSGWVAPIVMTTDGVGPGGISMPAGDFYYSNGNAGAQSYKKGHNPAYSKQAGAVPAVVTSLLMAADPVLFANPPGGAIADGEWSCHSCHGMHSRFSSGYTAYRQIKRTVNNIKIAGKTDTAAAGTETYTGPAENTAAGYEAITSNTRGDLGATGLVYVDKRGDGGALQGADLLAVYSDTNKNVYQGGFSSFCSACHGDFHGGNGEVEGTDNAKTHVGGAWIKHPTNLDMNNTGNRKYGMGTYKATVSNAEGINVNPSGYDFRYPLVKANNVFTVTSTVANASDPTTLATTDRLMCLTCHKAHASEFENMTRWDTNAHAFLADGSADVEGWTFDGTNMVQGVSVGDNPAYGCGKCHQKGGTAAYVKTGF